MTIPITSIKFICIPQIKFGDTFTHYCHCGLCEIEFKNLVWALCFKLPVTSFDFPHFKL